MALIQQAWDNIPNVLTDWAPSFAGLTKILGYWIEARAKIAFMSRDEPLMVSLKHTLVAEYALWLNKWSKEMIGSVLKAVKWWLCDLFDILPSVLDVVEDAKNWIRKSFCEADWSWEGSTTPPNITLLSPKRNFGGDTKTPPPPPPPEPTLPDNKTTDAKEVSKPGKVRKMLNKVVNGTVKKWRDFKSLVKKMVTAVFFPLFFSVAVPIAHNIRMELSKGLVEFAINYIIEIITKIPVLGSVFGFMGDDATIPILHKFGSARLLPIIYESAYMDDLELTIHGAYRKWILGYPSFEAHTTSWIMRSYSTVSKVKRNVKDKKKGKGTKDDPADAHSEEKMAADLKCSRFKTPTETKDCNEYLEGFEDKAEDIGNQRVR